MKADEVSYHGPGQNLESVSRPLPRAWPGLPQEFVDVGSARSISQL